MLQGDKTNKYFESLFERRIKMPKTAKKRGNGIGSIQVRKERTNPFIAKVGCSVIDQKTGKVKYKYKRIGSFKTRFEAEYALQRIELQVFKIENI